MKTSLRMGGSAIVLAAALGLSALGSASSVQAAAPEAVTTASGPVKATVRGDMTTYFAIPYAAPPVGELRWKAPQPAANWTAPLEKTKSSAACLQPSMAIGRASSDSEDCLYLDVHRPSGEGKFPVMVWIHGGAFTSGSAGGYADPSALVTKGVIVVAINYRLGALGFLAHPALRDQDGSSGNYGIMDQQAALRWVQANIASFGGDPKNVTIFGESAGGFSVLSHLAAPGSAGLFQKAIIQSGAYGVSGQLTQADLEAKSAEALTATLASAGADSPAACAGSDLTAACLRAMPESLVRSKLLSAFTKVNSNVIPSVDAKVLPQTIKATFVAGKNNKVPLINGSNENENDMFVAIGEMTARFAAKPPNFDPANRAFVMSPEAYAKGAADLAAQSGHSVEDIKTKYYPLSAYGSDPVMQPSLVAGVAGTDSIFSCNGINVSARVAGQGSPVWMYEYRNQSAPPLVGSFGGKYMLTYKQGAAHAAELPYLFNMLPIGGAEQTALKEAMTGYWTNFARTGTPNGKGSPQWAAYKTGKIQALDIADQGGIAPMPAKAFRTQHQCDGAWANLTF